MGHRTRRAASSVHPARPPPPATPRGEHAPTDSTHWALPDAVSERRGQQSWPRPPGGARTRPGGWGNGCPPRRASSRGRPAGAGSAPSLRPPAVLTGKTRPQRAEPASPAGVAHSVTQGPRAWQVRAPGRNGASKRQGPWAGPGQRLCPFQTTSLLQPAPSEKQPRDLEAASGLDG